MKALTIQNPWAWAVAAGHKPIERRSRAIRYRGEVAIHAGAIWSPEGARSAPVVAAWAETTWVATECDPHSALFAYAAVIAVAEIGGCHRALGCCGPWGEPEDLWHWELANVQQTDPIWCRGRQGLWTLPPDVEEAVRFDIARVLA